jgi:uncharacterized protein
MPPANRPSAPFPITAAAFEGGLAILAIVLGWLLDQQPLATFRFEFSALGLALAATAPLLGLFWFTLKCPWRPLADVTRFLDEQIVPHFRNCSLIELAIIALLAGVGEETLFRGVVQPAVADAIGGPHGVLLGLLIAAMLFGLLHPITPAYAALAGLIGLYLGWVWLACGNLLVPVVIHAVYDFWALAYMVRFRPPTDD